MIRFFAILVGLGFVLVSAVSFISGFGVWIGSETQETVELKYHEHAHDHHFTFDGPFGHFDQQQLQRGYQVYKEVCSTCHGLDHVAYRNLAEIGYSEAEVKAIARQAPEVAIPDPESGEVGKGSRKALPSDHFPSPYPNEIAARAANNNAVPPDLSLIAKARNGGADYIYALLTGYGKQVPGDVEMQDGLYYNPYFHSIKIAMAPPLRETNQVTYQDGTPATVEQMAEDVSAFLTWAAEPNLEKRHIYGWAVLIFLIFATILAWFAYKNVWADKKVKKIKKVAE